MENCKVIAITNQKGGVGNIIYSGFAAVFTLKAVAFFVV